MSLSRVSTSFHSLPLFLLFPALTLNFFASLYSACQLAPIFSIFSSKLSASNAVIPTVKMYIGSLLKKHTLESTLAKCEFFFKCLSLKGAIVNSVREGCYRHFCKWRAQSSFLSLKRAIFIAVTEGCYRQFCQWRALSSFLSLKGDIVNSVLSSFLFLSLKGAVVLVTHLST